MAVAKIIEINSSSPNSFEEAIRSGINTASETIHNIQGAWVKEQKVVVADNDLSEFRVDLYLTFLLDDGEKESSSTEGGEQ